MEWIGIFWNKNNSICLDKISRFNKIEVMASGRARRRERTRRCAAIECEEQIRRGAWPPATSDYLAYIMHGATQRNIQNNDNFGYSGFANGISFNSVSDTFHAQLCHTIRKERSMQLCPFVVQTYIDGGHVSKLHSLSIGLHAINCCLHSTWKEREGEGEGWRQL